MEQMFSSRSGLLAPAAVRGGLAALLAPPSDISVTESAERHRVLHNPGGGYSGPYRSSLVPYAREPQDALTDRRFRIVCFVGPGQSSKTDILLNWATHTICEDPADMMLVLDEKDQAEDFIDRRVKRLIQYSGDIAARLTDEKRYSRLFRGMMLTVAWATASKAASKPVPRVGIDERDSMDDDLGGEGDPVDLFLKRLITFGDAGKMYVASSPKKPVRRMKGEGRAPLGPHEAPPTTGILALYNRGTKKRLYWPCPDCGEWHTPEFSMLRWPEKVTSADRDFEVALECPLNGCAIECDPWMASRHSRPDMLALARWLAAGQSIDADARVHGAPPALDIDSYWLKGPQAAFVSWGELVVKNLAAEEEFVKTGSDAKRKTFWQLDDGTPWEAPPGEDEVRLDAEALKGRAEDYPLGQVPAAARFLTAQVDVQSNRFEVEIAAWGVGLERWTVDRFAVFKVVDANAAGGERLVDPATKAADWDLLFDRVLDRSYPIDGSALHAKIACTAIDAFGADGVTTQAYDFWRRARKRGFGRQRLMLTKGATRADAPLITWSKPELAGARQKRSGGYAELATVNVSSLKDVAARRLGLEEPGPLYMHFSAALAKLSGVDFFAELTAEAKSDDKWQKLRSRNEAWDHLVQSIAIALHLRANQVDWAKPPAWAKPWAENAYVTPGTAPSPAPDAQASPAAHPEPVEGRATAPKSSNPKSGFAAFLAGQR